jgi:hypothetical protein
MKTDVLKKINEDQKRKAIQKKSEFSTRKIKNHRKNSVVYIKFTVEL